MTAAHCPLPQAATSPHNGFLCLALPSLFASLPSGQNGSATAQASSLSTTDSPSSSQVAARGLALLHAWGGEARPTVPTQGDTCRGWAGGAMATKEAWRGTSDAKSHLLLI